jgi:hypothetical protein
MKVKAVFLCLSILSLEAHASQGLLDSSIFLCNADQLTTFMVQSCAARYPQLSENGARVLQSWKLRNSSDAETSARHCRAELRESVSSEEEFHAGEESVQKLQDAWKERYIKSVVENGAQACQQAFDGMADPKADLKNYLK